MSRPLDHYVIWHEPSALPSFSVDGWRDEHLGPGMVIGHPLFQQRLFMTVFQARRFADALMEQVRIWERP